MQRYHCPLAECEDKGLRCTWASFPACVVILRWQGREGCRRAASVCLLLQLQLMIQKMPTRYCRRHHRAHGRLVEVAGIVVSSVSLSLLCCEFSCAVLSAALLQCFLKLNKYPSVTRNPWMADFNIANGPQDSGGLAGSDFETPGK